MKRVLIITYYWPPTGGSGVQRWVKFAKYLPQFGWQPVIYSPENPERPVVDESLQCDVPPEAEVVKTPILEPYALYRKLMGQSSSIQMTELTRPAGDDLTSFKKKLSLAIRGNCFIPDPRVLWVRPSVRFLRSYLKDHPVDAIISTGPPHSVHLTARDISRETGIPWIMDFRDPWTGIYYFDKLHLSACSRRRYFKMEFSCLDAASTVLTCTPAVQKDYASRTSTPVEMITNGFDPDDYNQTPAPDGYFNLTQTGQLGADGNPVVLWKVLSDLCKESEKFRSSLRIRLLGTIDAEVVHTIEEAGLSDNLVNLGYQPHSVAIREQVSASLLLIPLRKSPEMAKILPGKVFEYMAARRPVLGFGQEDGTMADIIRQTGCGRMCDWNNEEGVKEAVLEAWKRHCDGIWAFEAEGYLRYARRELTGKLVELLNKITK